MKDMIHTESRTFRKAPQLIKRPRKLIVYFELVGNAVARANVLNQYLEAAKHLSSKPWISLVWDDTESREHPYHHEVQRLVRSCSLYVAVCAGEAPAACGFKIGAAIFNYGKRVLVFYTGEGVGMDVIRNCTSPLIECQAFEWGRIAETVIETVEKHAGLRKFRERYEARKSR